LKDFYKKVTIYKKPFHDYRTKIDESALPKKIVFLLTASLLLILFFTVLYCMPLFEPTPLLHPNEADVADNINKKRNG